MPAWLCLSHDIKKEELLLIIGSVKTGLDWMLVAFSNIYTKSSMSLEVQAANIVSAKGHVFQARSVTGLRMRREGDLYRKTSPETTTSSENNISFPATSATFAATSTSSSATASTADDANQCISLIRLKVQRRLGIMRKVVVGVGYHQLPRRDGEKDGVGGDGITVDKDPDAEEDSWLDVTSEICGKVCVIVITPHLEL